MSSTENDDGYPSIILYPSSRIEDECLDNSTELILFEDDLTNFTGEFRRNFSSN